MSTHDARLRVYKWDHFLQHGGPWEPLGISYPILGEHRYMLDVTHPNIRSCEPLDTFHNNITSFKLCPPKTAKLVLNSKSWILILQDVILDPFVIILFSRDHELFPRYRQTPRSLMADTN
jgi:hypothetical protein